ncbi:hypothetical protein E1B28_011179 [Marasmius oreades]|uniref:Uncharacterized protein n=1 Tax=Marasmius oreades TaxID=181124 RepID=A0A9P7RTJ1_9AGAR|nr:uncharacterized protein E1B28_011179 [Marasmius oreades]XP_043005970.1 uncharacterized protein E1B28_011179 [Marasmius oreades]KAG7089499.1 hypothetical protein E1B28_011179 [Marasmius oreades]KAG7089500.1 hypothetical protein E1B28_011179 [Marasmius oreades]
MSALMKNTVRYTMRPHRLLANNAARSLSTRRYSSTMHDNDPVTLETEKQRNLSRTQHKTSTPHANAPGWNESLATSSEASVKADRSDGSPTQAETVEYILNRHSPDDRVHTQATFVKDVVEGPLGAKRDEVSGPLGTAEGREDTETLVKRTVREETTEVKRGATSSEENVKADRGEI